MKKSAIALSILGLFCVSSASASILSVSGPDSNRNVAASIISTLGSTAANASEANGQQGFDEQQGVVLAAALNTDYSTIAANTTVNSHLIFLDPIRRSLVTHADVEWVFNANILGVMSVANGRDIANSSAVLGALNTTYFGTARGRGFEWTGRYADDYTVSGDTLTLTMNATYPGDWIRVITEVPEPASMAVFGLGLLGLGFANRRRKQQ